MQTLKSIYATVTEANTEHECILCNYPWSVMNSTDLVYIRQPGGWQPFYLCFLKVKLYLKTSSLIFVGSRI